MNRKAAASATWITRVLDTLKLVVLFINVSTPVKAIDLQAMICLKDTPFVRQSTLVINQSVSQLVEAIDKRIQMEQLIDKVKGEVKTCILSSNIL